MGNQRQNDKLQKNTVHLTQADNVFVEPLLSPQDAIHSPQQDPGILDITRPAFPQDLARSPTKFTVQVCETLTLTLLSQTYGSQYLY